MLDTTIADRVRSLRVSRGLRQEDVASALNQSRATYTQKDNGTRPFTLGDIVELAQYFQVSTDELLMNIKPHHVDIHNDLGLDDAAIEAIAGHNTRSAEDEDYIEPDSDLNRALASPAILRALSEYMAFIPEDTAHGVGFVHRTKGYVDCRMTHGMYNAVLAQNLIRIIEAVKRGEEPEVCENAAVLTFADLVEEGGAADAEKK